MIKSYDAVNVPQGRITLAERVYNLAALTEELPPAAEWTVDNSLVYGVCKKINSKWVASMSTLELLADLQRKAEDSKKIEPTTKRANILDEAKKLTTGSRNEQYGEPIDDFTRIADALNALGYLAPHANPIRPHDVSIIQSVVKLSRIVNSPQKEDSWVDLAGYAAVGGEVAEIEGRRAR